MVRDEKLEKLYEKQLEIVKDLYSRTDEESHKVLKKADEVIDRSGYATREGGGELRCGTMAYNKQGEPLDCLTNHPCVDCYELIIIIPPGS